MRRGHYPKDVRPCFSNCDAETPILRRWSQHGLIRFHEMPTFRFRMYFFGVLKCDSISIIECIGMQSNTVSLDTSRPTFVDLPLPCTFVPEAKYKFIFRFRGSLPLEQMRRMPAVRVSMADRKCSERLACDRARSTRMNGWIGEIRYIAENSPLRMRTFSAPAIAALAKDGFGPQNSCSKSTSATSA